MPPLAGPNWQTLEAALAELDQPWVLVGDPFTVGGLSILGLTPGDITPAMNPDFIERIYEEYSSQPVDFKLRGFAPTVDIPLIWGDPAVYAKVSPTGAAAGGHSTPQAVTYTSLIIVPQSEFDPDDGWEHDGTDWVTPDGGPEHAIWLPKGYFSGAFPTFGSHNTENKNRTGSVTFTGVLADAEEWPEGAKSWIIGNPEDHDVEDLAIGEAA